MNIHEYQAKSLLRTYGLPVSQGFMAETVDEALSNYEKLGQEICVLKAQIHAGGRGKAGGVIVCKSAEDVKKAAQKLLHSTLITHQTGPQGQLVRKLYLEEGANIDKEFYLAVVLDRRLGCLTIIASPQGGMDIEEVAKNNPQAIYSVPIHPASGVMAYQSRFLGFELNLTTDQKRQLAEIIDQIYLFIQEKDAALVEINPLCLTKEGQFLVLDAKISFDDNALPRQADIETLRDIHEEDPSETQARAADLSYIKMNGKIGCMVNGAGLAMATMDIINLFGEQPANFLDVGGGATQEKVETAFRIILADPDVKGIFVNIFGGIMRCDIIAQGIVGAAKSMNIHVPVVVRLQGTNMHEGQKILAESGLKITPVDDLERAAAEIVNQVRTQSEF